MNTTNQKLDEIADILKQTLNEIYRKNNNNGGNTSFSNISNFNVTNIDDKITELTEKLNKKYYTLQEKAHKKQYQEELDYYKRLKKLKTEEERLKKELIDGEEKYRKEIEKINKDIDKLNDGYEKNKLKDKKASLTKSFEKSKKDYEKELNKITISKEKKEKQIAKLPFKENDINNTFRTLGLGKMVDTKQKFQSLIDAGSTMELWGGKTIGKVGNVLGGIGKFLKPAGYVLGGLQLLGDGLNALAETSYKLSEIENKRATLSTEYNIAMSKLDLESGLSNYNTEFQKGMIDMQNVIQSASQEMSIIGDKAIANNQARINMAIGNINDTAWEALSAQTDIDVKEKQYELDEKLRRDTATINKEVLDVKNASVQANLLEQRKSQDITYLESQTRLNQEARALAREHPYAKAVSSVVDPTEPSESYTAGGKDYAKDKNKNSIAPEYRSTVVQGASALGVLVGDGYAKAADTYYKKIEDKEITRLQNEQKASQAQVEMSRKIADTVIDSTSQIKTASLNATNEIKKQVASIYGTIKKQYIQLAQKIEQWALAFQKSSVLSAYGKGFMNREQHVQYENFMRDASGRLENLYGLNPEEVFNIQDQINQGTGRNRIADYNDMANIASLDYYMSEKGIGAQLASSSEIFNTNIKDSIKSVTVLVKQAHKIGLDGRKLTKDIVKNLKQAEKYNFKDGQEGLMKMVKWAQNVRFNMDSVPQIVDKIADGDLENAITMGARLQVLGGKFAMGADPIAMIYESYNNANDLASRYNQMLKGMGGMDSKTGEVTFAQEEQMLMRQFAKITGQDFGDVYNQARFMVKNEKLRNLISPNIKDEEQRKLLVNLANKNKETGAWEVKTLDGERKDISTLTEADMKNIQPQDTDELLRTSIEKTIAYQDKMTGIQEAQKTYLGILAVGPEFLKEQMEKRQELSKKNIEENGQTMVNETHDNIIEATNAIDKSLKDKIEPLNKQAEILGNIDGKMNDVLSNLQTIVKNELPQSDSEQLASAKVGNDFNGAKVKIGGNNYSVEKLIDKGFITGKDSGNNIVYNNLKMQSAVGGSNWRSDYSEGSVARNTVANKFGNTKSGVIGIVNSHNKYLAEINKQKALINDNANNYSKLRELLPEFKAQIKYYEKELATGNYSVEAYNQLKRFKTLYNNTVQSDEVAKANAEISKSRYDNRTISTETIDDGAITEIGSGSKVTAVQSNPNDTALFAKEGGPFDTLFNDVFGKINEVNNFVKSNGGLQNMIQPRSMPYLMPDEPINYDNNNNNNNNANNQNNQRIQLEPLKVEINGKLDLNSGNGNSVDIMQELQRNPMLLRSLVQMITESINQSIYGGKTTNTMGYSASRFNSINF